MKINLIIFIFLFTSAKADVLSPPVPYQEVMIAPSLEGIFSLENSLNKYFSFIFWGGIGYLQVLYPEVTPAWGLETSIGTRIYPFSTNRNKFFMGIYGGYALMFGMYDINHGIAVGVKTGYKHIIKQKEHRKFSFEPYFSVSILPFDFYFNDPVIFIKYPLFTIGLRFVFESSNLEKKRGEFKVEEEVIKIDN